MFQSKIINFVVRDRLLLVARSHSEPRIIIVCDQFRWHCAIADNKLRLTCSRRAFAKIISHTSRLLLRSQFNIDVLTFQYLPN